MFRPPIGAVVALLIFPTLTWASGSGGGQDVIRNIGLAIVAASGMGFVMKVLRQPLLLGYVLGGVLLGPIGLGLVTAHEDIEALSQIGLILLLFMIGLEIDLKKMFDSGRLVVLTGLLQFPVSLGVGWVLLKLLAAAGLFLGEGPYAVLYVATAISLSSTMIVVKLLYDKLE
ncbi:MAG TPA: cation:proton antiporter, partial [Myxococcaceae bacterium]|nr:cation:proton antiporter [Myxococcaceae bacterium]